MYKYLQEHTSGIAVLKTYVAETHDTIGLIRILKDAIRKEFASGMMGTMAALVSGFISSLGPILLLWFGIIEIVNGRLTLGGLIAFNSFLVYLFNPLSSISGINVTIKTPWPVLAACSIFWISRPSSLVRRVICRGKASESRWPAYSRRTPAYSCLTKRCHSSTVNRRDM